MIPMEKYLLLNKPRGYITAMRDPRHKTVAEFLKPEECGGVFPVGRLDKETEGLLLFTSDGRYASKVMSPLSAVKKTYFFISKYELDPGKLDELTRGARVFPDKTIVTAPAEVEIIEKTVLSMVREYLNGDELLYSEKKPNTTAYIGKVTVTEGKKHEVRRMIAYAGGRVVYLGRVSIGALSLGDLRVGEMKVLSEKEALKVFE